MPTLLNALCNMQIRGQIRLRHRYSRIEGQIRSRWRPEAGEDPRIEQSEEGVAADHKQRDADEPVVQTNAVGIGSRSESERLSRCRVSSRLPGNPAMIFADDELGSFGARRGAAVGVFLHSVTDILTNLRVGGAEGSNWRRYQAAIRPG